MLLNIDFACCTCTPLVLLSRRDVYLLSLPMARTRRKGAAEEEGESVVFLLGVTCHICNSKRCRKDCTGRAYRGAQGRVRADWKQVQGRLEAESGQIRSRVRADRKQSQGRLEAESGQIGSRVRADRKQSQGRVVWPDRACTAYF